MLSDTSFAERITYHTMLQDTTVQLIFGNNMILNTPFIADWKAIMELKQQLIYKNN